MRSLAAGWMVLCVFVLAGAAPALAQSMSSTRESVDQVKALNAFADKVLQTHRHRIKARETQMTERLGGYARLPDFYREKSYVDVPTGRLLGTVQWETGRADTVHRMELFFYDGEGRIKVDYLVTYLTDFRNAPIQSLINIHYHDGELSAFRQFDALGDRLFERCEGTHFGEKVDIYIDELDPDLSPEQVPAEIYLACFGALPTSVGGYADPLSILALEDASLAPGAGRAVIGGAGEDAFEKMERRIVDITAAITADPDSADLYVMRGEARFLVRVFDEAIADFTRAIALDANLDRAYFGRGMVRGRAGDLEGGITDLTVFLDRNPKSALGYTKRGVRHIWNQDFQKAERDLRTAIALDPHSAEAHDDLGVVLAQDKRYDEAARHFERARSIEPSYQKAHHNLAMVRYIEGDMVRALDTIDGALGLAPNARDSLMLKALILDALGRASEAEVTRTRAEFLPVGDRSERSALR